MNEIKIISVVGARPNFMKVAPIHRAILNYNKKNNNVKIIHKICHTGQHYDEKMSKIFFDDLELPKPDFYLGVGSGSHAQQTGKIMIEFEKVLQKESPDYVLVVGDVNSTIAASLTAKKMGIKVIHVESGLRSFDMSMPEEINRILTDRISDLLFVTEISGVKNLQKEGIPDDKIFLVGNVMIDSVKYYLSKTENNHDIFSQLEIKKNNYFLVTLHRPSNVDNKSKLEKLINLLNNLSKIKTIIFPIHPRTKQNINNFGLTNLLSKNIKIIEPLGYIDFLTLIRFASLILTDSGGIQEESTFLQVPCITLRDSTERPITVDIGTNYLLGDNLKLAELTAIDIIKGNVKKGKIPELWDGNAAERILEIIIRYHLENIN